MLRYLRDNLLKDDKNLNSNIIDKNKFKKNIQHFKLKNKQTYDRKGINEKMFLKIIS